MVFIRRQLQICEDFLAEVILKTIEMVPRKTTRAEPQPKGWGELEVEFSHSLGGVD